MPDLRLIITLLAMLASAECETGNCSAGRSLLQRKMGAGTITLAKKEINSFLSKLKVRDGRKTNNKELFEGCRVPQQSAPPPARVAQVQADSSSCAADEIVLTQESASSVETSCCKSGSLSCAGCSKLSNGKCGLCYGGYHLKDGSCTACADFVHWVNDDGKSCHAVSCSDTKHFGISSNEACCKCGGGSRTATAFAFKTVNLQLGSSGSLVTAVPTPRTAKKYSIDDKCELLNHGLTIDGKTGALSLVAGCDKIGCGNIKPFKVSCIVTAHQSPELNATAMLNVVASKFAYPDSPLVARPGAMQFSPLATVEGASMTCAPSSVSAWLSIDKDATLKVTKDKITDLKGLSGLDQFGLVGGRCLIKAKKSSDNVNTTVSVLVPQIWPSFSYSAATVFAAVGEAAAPLKVSGSDKTLLAPSRFSVACNSNPTTASFAFDSLTGVATVNGHVAFTLDLASGGLHVVPSKSLAHVLDELIDDSVSRKTITLSCKVYGHYAEQQSNLLPLRAASSTLTIELRDDTCWVERKANFAAMEGKKGVSARQTDCRKACRESPVCTDFGIIKNACTFMTGLCLGSECPLKNYPVTTKIPNCGERRTCLKLFDSEQGYISGEYCPVADSTNGPIFLKEGETVPDTLYLTKMDAARDGTVRGCEGADDYVLKQSAPGLDFEDPESSYLELKGATLKCIKSESGDFFSKLFSEGELDSEKYLAQIAGMSCGPPNTTMDKSDEEGEEEDGVETIVLDDPATRIADDYWLNPCSCFPEAWGPSKPVSEDSYAAVPAGSDNTFTPGPFEIVAGSFTCEAEFLVNNEVIFEGAESGGDPAGCAALCGEHDSCKFFWEGVVADAKQCRLFTDCQTLVREPGAEGSLKVSPKPTKQYCRMADPAKCWKVRGRRDFLGAAMPGSGSMDCAWSDLLKQCDHKLLLGGFGVEACGVCSYMEAADDPNFLGKKKLPEAFEHGQRLGVSCWSERFRTAGTSQEHLTCVSGSWLDSSGAPGLSNFACAACLQVTSPPYSQLDGRKKQELYFASRMEVTITAMLKTPKYLLRSGSFFGHVDDAWTSSGKVPSNNPLDECQGDCDTDADCAGDMICFKRSGYTAVPGCAGSGTKNTDYCIVGKHHKLAVDSISKDWAATLSECQGHCSSSSHCSGSLRCWTSGGAVPGCKGTASSGWSYCYDAAKYKIIDSSPGGDGIAKLLECEGDCDSDSDCKGNLKCFLSDVASPYVPNCKGKAVKGRDYCYDPDFAGLKSFKNYGGNGKANMGVCEGDCDADSDCASGLKCFLRDGNANAPGCKDAPSKSGYDTCYDPKASASIQYGNLGSNPRKKLLQCEGDCDSDSDCAGSLKCFKRSGYTKVPGCSGGRPHGWDYCYEPGTTSLKSTAKPSPTILAECQGDCDKDSDCAKGLKCFKRKSNEPIPGCEGAARAGWDYCYDHRKAFENTGTVLDLDLTGFVSKTLVSQPEELRLFQSTGDPKRCLQVTDGKGVTSKRCASPAIESQLIATNAIPMLLKQEMLLPGTIIQATTFATGKSLMDVTLDDLKLDYDCGEHALQSIGFLEQPAHKMSMFASCGLSANIGSPSTHSAEIGGEVDVEFSTCTSARADTGDGVQYSINGGSIKTLGSSGRKKGDKDKNTLAYSGSFKSLRIKADGADGWRICRFRFSGEELPTASVAFNFPELPCFVDDNHNENINTASAAIFDNGYGCSSKVLEVKGNRAPFELAGARIECPMGKVITSIKKLSREFKYNCSAVAGLGSCSFGQSPQVDMSSGALDGLKHLKIMCPQGELLQSLVAEESSGGKWLRYRYSCCATSGIPAAITPSGRFVAGEVQKFEGIYCPTGPKDASGRLGFERVLSFDSGNSKKWSLQYDRTSTQWCIKDGNKKETCQKSDAAHPLEAGFLGTSWEAITLSDFDGEFAARGASKPSASLAKRQKPALIKFGATQPEYKEECKDEVTPGETTFDKDKMNEDGLGLDEGNPCKNIAGKITKTVKDTLFGPVINHEGQGNSTWSTHGYDDTDTEWDAGSTYDSIRSCADREISRDLKAAKWAHTHDTVDNVLGIKEGMLGVPCSLLPSMASAPMGFGPSWNPGKTCGQIAKMTEAIAGFANDQILIENERGMADGDNSDCNSQQHFLSRVFCDLHCLRDSVRSGDQAILRSMEDATVVIGKNTDLLMEYYAGTLQDSLDEISQALPKPESSLAQTREMKSQLNGIFAEVRSVVQDGLGAGSHSAVDRAIKNFAARFAKKEGNVTTFLETRKKEGETLLAMVRTSAQGKLSNTASAASETASAVAKMQRVHRARSHMLGVYQMSSQKQKTQQQQLRSSSRLSSSLVDELLRSSARTMLLDLDRSWWAIRGELDKWIDAGDSQVQSYGHAFSLLDAYTSSCTAGFSELKLSYRQAMKAEKAAHQQLQSTWVSVLQQLGLLAAKISDGDAFLQLGRLDAAALSMEDLALNQSSLCGNSGSGSVVRALGAKTSLVQQTMSQVQTVFMEMPMLRDRFLTGGLKKPDEKPVLDAWWRIASAYDAARQQQESLAADVLMRLQRERCAAK